MAIIPHARPPAPSEPHDTAQDLPHGLVPRPVQSADAAARQHLSEGQYVARLLREGHITAGEAAELRRQIRAARHARAAAAWQPAPGQLPVADAARAYVESLLPPVVAERPAAAAPRPEVRAEVAKALLRRWAPVEAILLDDADYAADAGADLAGLEDDPRYLIGRLQQALTALLQGDLPPLDATARLAADAIGDAIRWQDAKATACECGAACDQCRPHTWRSVAYETLFRELGLTERRPDIGRLPLGDALPDAQEAAARAEAAAQARGEFERAWHGHAMNAAPAPDWQAHARQLSAALAAVLDVLGLFR